MNRLLKKIKEQYSTFPVNVKAAFWFLISSFFQRGISVITTPVFTRLMSASEYGEFSVFYSWYGIITIFVTLNLFFGVYTRGLVSFEEDRDEFSSSMQGLMLLLVLGWFLVYILFRPFFNSLFSLSTFEMIALFAIIWSNGAYCFWAAEQRVTLKYTKLVLVSMITAAAIPVAQILLILLMEDAVKARILGLLAVSVIFYPMLFYRQIKKGKRLYSARYWRYALAFNIPLIPHYLSQTILNSADRLMIRDMVGTAEAGIYSLAYSVSQIMTIFNTAMMQSIEPWLYKKIRDNQIRDISKVAYPSFIIVAVINLLLICLAPEVISFFAPREYYDAIWIIPPVAMSVFFTFAYTFFAVFEFYYKKTQYIAMATSIGAVLNIVLNYFFIKRFGYIAAGYTTLICYMTYALFHYIFMYKICKINLNGCKPFNSKIIWAITVGVLCIGFGVMTTYQNYIARYQVLFITSLIFIGKRRKIKELIDGLIKIRTE